MTRTGRRPGRHDTRAEIVGAASAVFSEIGYADASLRSIAQRAGVDAALVHHYFDGKVSLYIEAMGLPRDMREVPAELREQPASGASLVRAFLRIWDAHAGETSGPNPFLSLVQAICSSPQAAGSLGEFLAERIAPQAADAVQDSEWPLRRALIGSQLIGLAFQRYIMRADPVATAAPGQVAEWVGPAIDRYLHEPVTGGARPA